MSLSDEPEDNNESVDQLGQQLLHSASISRHNNGHGLTRDMSTSGNDDVSRVLSFNDGKSSSLNNNKIRKAEGNASPTKGEKSAQPKRDGFASPSAARRDDTNGVPTSGAARTKPTTFTVDESNTVAELVRIQRQIEELISSKQLSEQESDELDKQWNLFKKFIRGGCSSEQLDALIREELSDYEGNHNIVNYESDDVIASMPFSATTKSAAAAIATHATEKGEHFCGIDSRTCDERYHRIALINDFPVPGNEKYGPLTGRIGEYSRPGDFLPRNATAWAEFFSLVITLHLQYGMAIDKALYIVTHSCLWLDILCITQDKNASGSGSRYKTLRDLCDEDSVKFIWGVLKESSVTHVVVNGVPAFQFIQDHPEAIPDDVKMLQKCKIVHASKIIQGVRDREMWEKINTLGIVVADILGEEPKPPISIARISSAFWMLGEQGLFDAQGNSVTGGSGDYFYEGLLNGNVVMKAHDATDMVAQLSKVLGFSAAAEFPSQAEITNINKDFLGLTFNLRDYTEFNHATDRFGIIECEALSNWVSLHSRDMPQELANYEEKCEGANDALLAPSP